MAPPADIRGMTAGFFGRLPRVALIACAIGLLSATITFAASSTLSSPTPPAAAPVAAVEPEALVVPDVRKQAYVFAKGSLEQEGFAWRVEGWVPGYAANVVVSQEPAPGSRVVPDGAPIVVLRLSRNSAYGQEGKPESVAPYLGKAARLVGVAQPKPKSAETAAKPPAAARKPKPAAANPAARKSAFTVPGVAEAISGSIDADLQAPGVTDVTATYREGSRLAKEGRADYLLPTIVHATSPEAAITKKEFMFPFATVVECPEAKMLDAIGPTLVCTAVTCNETFRSKLLDAVHIDRLNLGPVPTSQLNWRQPHEGNIVEFLFRARAFQGAPVT